MPLPRWFRCAVVVAAIAAGAARAQGGGPRFDITRFVIDGNTLLKSDVAEQAVKPYTGKSRDFSDVQRALEALQQAYRDAGYGAVDVQLPEQELERGEVRFRVVESKIRKVIVESGAYHDDSNLRASLPAIQEGKTPVLRQLSGNLRLANENPAKQTAVTMKATDQDGLVDMTIRVDSQPPQRVSVSLDNTGSPSTGIARLGVGFQHANVFNRDHVMSVQYITSPEKLRDVTILGVGYKVPLYGLNDSLEAVAGYSDVNSGVVQNLFSVSGKGNIFGLRYNHLLRRIGEAYEHRLTYGLDYRAYKNAVIPLGTGLSLVPDITTRPISATYSGSLRSSSGEQNYFVSLARNLPGGKNGGRADFDAARLGASANYSVLRYGANINQAILRDWQMRLAFNGQETRAALIPGEQFGVGGLDNVRGYNEREVSNDRGYSGNVEVYSPDFGNSTLRTRALAFYDFGRVRRNQSQPGEIADQRLASTGIGLRLIGSAGYSLRLDLAHVLTAAGTQEVGDKMIHTRFGYSF